MNYLLFRSKLILTFILLTSIHAWEPDSWLNYISNGSVGDELPEFSYAGFYHGEKEIPDIDVVVNVTDFGANPLDSIDDTEAINDAVASAVSLGGGAVFLPRGRYFLNSSKTNTVIRVTGSNIVLRGEGSGKDGTIIHLKNSINSERNDAALVFRGSGSTSLKATFTSSQKRGDTIISISGVSGLSAGQLVRIDFNEPVSNATASTAQLSAAFISPFKLSDDLSTTYGVKEVSWLVEIAQILSSTSIRLKQPLRVDVPLSWNAEISSYTAIHDVGVENLRFESSWVGHYQHHKSYTDPLGNFYSEAEQDYLWSATLFYNVHNGWIRDVVIEGYNEGIFIQWSKGVVAENVNSEGITGHTFLTFIRSHDNLMKNCTLSAPVIHTAMMNAWASGNVVTQCSFEFGPYDSFSSSDVCFDFHGLFPYENLYDHTSKAYVYPGGAFSYLPHAGIRNVFWNITAPAQMNRGGSGSEFFRTYAPTSSGASINTNAFEHFPQAFVIGLHRDGGSQVTIQGKTEDRKDEWLTIEGLNRTGVEPPSLYNAQLSKRLGTSVVDPVDCNGVQGGTAFFDNCGICSGGNTGITPDNQCNTDCGNPVTVVASSDDGNVAANTLDNDTATRWSDSTHGAVLVYTFPCPRNLSQVGVDFYKGDERQTEFTIEVSIDSNHWEETFNGNSNGTATGTEWYPQVPYQLVNYVRITGYGNSQNNWNSITETVFQYTLEQDCDEIKGGSAFIDSCGICAGGATGTTPVLDAGFCNSVVTNSLKAISERQFRFNNVNNSVSFALKNAGPVNFIMYSLNGKQYVVFKDRHFSAQRHSYHLNTRDLLPGVYICRFKPANEPEKKFHINIQR